MKFQSPKIGSIYYTHRTAGWCTWSADERTRGKWVTWLGRCFDKLTKRCISLVESQTERRWLDLCLDGVHRTACCSLSGRIQHHLSFWCNCWVPGWRRSPHTWWKGTILFRIGGQDVVGKWVRYRRCICHQRRERIVHHFRGQKTEPKKPFLRCVYRTGFV